MQHASVWFMQHRREVHVLLLYLVLHVAPMFIIHVLILIISPIQVAGVWVLLQQQAVVTAGPCSKGLGSGHADSTPLHTFLFCSPQGGNEDIGNDVILCLCLSADLRLSCPVTRRSSRAVVCGAVAGVAANEGASFPFLSFVVLLVSVFVLLVSVFVFFSFSCFFVYRQRSGSLSDGRRTGHKAHRHFPGH